MRRFGFSRKLSSNDMSGPREELTTCRGISNGNMWLLEISFNSRWQTAVIPRYDRDTGKRKRKTPSVARSRWSASRFWELPMLRASRRPLASHATSLRTASWKETHFIANQVNLSRSRNPVTSRVAAVRDQSRPCEFTRRWTRKKSGVC